MIANIIIVKEQILPRASKAAKEKTHKNLLENAAQQLRLNGYAGLNLSEVMTSAGMTHGGFYRHFKNKEDLAISATRRAFDAFISKLEYDLEVLSARDALDLFVERYLSMKHLQNPANGCPVAALSGGAHRCSVAERAALETGTRSLIALIDTALAGCTPPIQLSGAALLGALSGALNLARLQTQTAEQEAILIAAQRHMRVVGVL